jgi:hypothetical protein
LTEIDVTGSWTSGACLMIPMQLITVAAPVRMIASAIASIPSTPQITRGPDGIAP